MTVFLEAGLDVLHESPAEEDTGAEDEGNVTPAAPPLQDARHQLRFVLLVNG